MTKRYHVSKQTISKWAKRTERCDGSSRPQTIHYALSELETLCNEWLGAFAIVSKTTPTRASLTLKLSLSKFTPSNFPLVIKRKATIKNSVLEVLQAAPKKRTIEIFFDRNQKTIQTETPAALEPHRENRPHSQKTVSGVLLKNDLDHVYAVSDSQGQILEHYRYSPFGQIEIYSTSDAYLGNTPSASTINNRLTWNTRKLDPFTNNYLYKYRSYRPTLGRFTQRDPIQEQGGINLYNFVGNNSLNKWDRLGNVPFDKWLKVFCSPSLEAGLQHFKNQVQFLQNKLNDPATTPEAKAIYQKNLIEMQRRIPLTEARLAELNAMKLAAEAKNNPVRGGAAGCCRVVCAQMAIVLFILLCPSDTPQHHGPPPVWLPDEP